MTNQESHLFWIMQKILMLQVLLRYFSGIFQVLFRYVPHLNKLTKSHIHEKAKETFVLSIKKRLGWFRKWRMHPVFLQNTSGSLGTFQVSTWGDGSKSYFHTVQQTWSTRRTNKINSNIGNSTPNQLSKFKKLWHREGKNIHLDNIPLYTNTHIHIYTYTHKHIHT